MTIYTKILLTLFLIPTSFAITQEPPLPLSAVFSEIFKQYLLEQKASLLEHNAAFCNKLSSEQKKRFAALIGEAQTIENDTVQTILKNRELTKKIDAIPGSIEILFAKYADVIVLYQQETGNNFLCDMFGILFENQEK